MGFNGRLFFNMDNNFGRKNKTNPEEMKIKVENKVEGCEKERSRQHCESVCVLQCWDGECMMNPPCKAGQFCVRLCKADECMVNLVNTAEAALNNNKKQCCDGGCNCKFKPQEEKHDDGEFNVSCKFNPNSPRPYTIQLSRPDCSKNELKFIFNQIEHLLSL